MSKALVVFSGGQDSTTCLYHARTKFNEVRALSINYGQRHARELQAAERIAELAGAEHEIINVPDILQSTSPLTDRRAELEQYADWQSLPGGLEKTFVPMRNMLFLTLAANRAVAWGCDVLVTGVCQEDFGGYPDCRETFIFSLKNAMRYGLALKPDDPFGRFEILTPLMHMTKAESVRLALSLSGCYGALGFSHTAYDGAYPPRGHDHATLLRAKGFEQAGVPDPLVVRAYWEGAMQLPAAKNYQDYKEMIDGYGRDADTFGYFECLNHLAQGFS